MGKSRGRGGPPKLPKYTAAVLKSAESMAGQTGVFFLSVAHDDWCDQLKGRGPCNCNPVIGKPERYDG